MKRKVLPVLVGRGMAGQAILKSLGIAAQNDLELDVLPVVQAARGEPLASYVSKEVPTVLFLANPGGLHAGAILEGAAAGYAVIAAEKPVCVRSEEIAGLKEVNAPVFVFHGYRVMWGTRTIKQMIEAGKLGTLISFESRYWQSSSAQMALSGRPDKRAWKNDPQLNGPYEALTDLGSHVVDTCLYLMGSAPIGASGWLGWQNAPAVHRDSHVHLCLDFEERARAFISISKTAHGATNNFEYTVIGMKGAATWRFLNPDEVECGEGNRTTIVRRETPYPATGSLAFHGLGWVEGYAEITRQSLRHAAGLPSDPVPTLGECLTVMDVLLNAEMRG